MAWTLRIAAAMVLYALVAPAMAQSSEKQIDPILREVQLLRHAVEDIARTGWGAQIAFGRLQMQEQRTNAAEATLKLIRANLDSTTQVSESFAAQLKHLETDPGSFKDELQLHGESVEAALQRMRQELERYETRRQRLMLEEGEAAQKLGFEQARLAEINQKLDDFERNLATRTR